MSKTPANRHSVEIQARLELGLSAAAEAEKTILSYFQGSDLAVETKSDKSVVTVADKEAEKILRSLIINRFPEDAIIGEELGSKDGTSGFAWILDPIDGTQSFVCGVPLFGTLLGIAYEGEPVAGIVNMPALKEVYYGSKGHGAWWKPAGAAAPRQAKVSNVAKLSESLYLTTSHAGFQRAGRMDLFEKLLLQTKKFRGWGSCYGHMLVATGRAELMVDPHVNLWDCAALFPIITEAGGHFVDLKGEPRIDSGSAISCNGEIINAVKALLISSEPSNS